MEVSGQIKDRSVEDNTDKGKTKPSDEEGTIFCQPCSSDDDMVVAVGYCQNCSEYMCVGCLKLHRRQAMSRNHNILDDDNMPKVAFLKVNLNACSDPCPNHVNEIIKYYCLSHDEVGCSDCVIRDHKSCQIERIQDLSSEHFNGTEHQDIAKKVEKFVNTIDKMKEDLHTSEKYIKQAREKAVKDVRAFKEEIVDYLDKAEREMLEMIAKKEQRDKSLILKLELDIKRINDEIRAIETKLKLQQNQQIKLFVEAKQLKVKLCSIKENIEQLKKYFKVELYEFRRYSRIAQIIDSGLKLGKLSILKGDIGIMGGHRAANEESVTCIANRSIFAGKHISEMDAYFDCEINFKLQDDASDCFVDDCVSMSQNQLVIADSSNNCIKIVDVKNKNVSKYKLMSSPYGVAVVKSNLIAVTLNKGSIQFLEITAEGKITEKDVIEVDKGCKKIAVFENRIIGITDTSVKVMSMTGEEIYSIYHPKMTWLIDIAVVPKSNMFYVSDRSYRNKSVYKFDFDGNLFATYENKDLVDVKGIEATNDGTLLV